MSKETKGMGICIECGDTTKGKHLRCDHCLHEREKMLRRVVWKKSASEMGGSYRRRIKKEQEARTKVIKKPILTDYEQRKINESVDNKIVGKKLHKNLHLHREVAWLFK